MADERSRMEASQALAEQLGPAAAAALMECIPPFGWHEIATKGDLVLVRDDLHRLESRMDMRFDALQSKLDGRFDALESRYDGRFEGLEGCLSALIERKASAQNRALLWAVATAAGVSLLTNLLS